MTFCSGATLVIAGRHEQSREVLDLLITHAGITHATFAQSWLPDTLPIRGRDARVNHRHAQGVPCHPSSEIGTSLPSHKRVNDQPGAAILRHDEPKRLLARGRLLLDCLFRMSRFMYSIHG